MKKLLLYLSNEQLFNSSATYLDGNPQSETLKNTSEAVFFLDELFGPTNAASLSKKETRGKRLRRAVTNTSAHGSQ